MSHILINWTEDKTTKVVDLINSYIKRKGMIDAYKLTSDDMYMIDAEDLVLDIINVLEPQELDYE